MVQTVKLLHFAFGSEITALGCSRAILDRCTFIIGQTIYAGMARHDLTDLCRELFLIFRGLGRHAFEQDLYLGAHRPIISRHFQTNILRHRLALASRSSLWCKRNLDAAERRRPRSVPAPGECHFPTPPGEYDDAT